MRKFLLYAATACLPLTCFSIPASAADFFVKGVVADSLTNETEPYATLRVDRADGSTDKAIALFVSDEKGAFSEQLPASGEYKLTVSGVGKHAFQRTFAVSDSVPVFDFGRILLRSGVELDEVNVVAQKPLVKAEIDKISYNIEDDPDSETKTTLEMLRKVPMVSVDGQDNITVNGSSNFKVYVNGKPNSLMSNNPKEVLKSLPASTIKSIEVITEPGAKYDAEGVGGILNIVTTDVKMQGYNVSVGANGSNRGVGGYFFGTAQIGKFTVSGNYSYSYSTWDSGDSRGERVDYDDAGNDNRILRMNQWGDNNKSKFQYGYLEGSYEPDTLNLITFSGNFYRGKSNYGTISETAMYDLSQTKLYSYRSNGPAENSYGSVGVNVDYQHSFARRKGEYFTLSYRFDNMPNSSKTSTFYTDLFNVPESFDLRGQTQDDDAHTSEHTVQADYVNPITEKHYVDGGLKFVARNNSSDSRVYFEGADGVFAYDEAHSSLFDQKQNILALYADYQLKLGKFGAKAGVRYEHTFMNVDYALHPEQNYSAGFDDVVPSVTLSYSLGMAQTLRLVYNMRLYRPGIWYLNPFRSSTSPTDVSYGNPDLQTEKYHSVGMRYSSFLQHFNINLGLNYDYVGNGISGYSFVRDGVRESTYGNIVEQQTVFLSAWLNWNPTAKTRFTLNMSGAYDNYKSDVLGEKNDGFQMFAYGSFEQELFWKINLNAYGGGSTPYVSLQSKGSSYNYYGLSLYRKFLKDDRLSVSIFAGDFLQKKQKRTTTYSTASYRSTSHMEFSNYNFGISLSWRFGDLKAQVKRAQRGISNDDVKDGGGQQGGQSSGGGR